MQTIDIEEIGAGGVGVGRLADGRVVFVHGTAPGERVAVQPVDVRKDWARARLVNVVEPSADRRPPPCRHAGRCGGCTLQHLRYERQLHAKSNIVARALRHIAHTDVAPTDVVPSPHEQAYRSRISFSMLRLGSGHVIAGFHELENPGRIIDIGEECLLPEPALTRAWGALRREWGHNAGRLPAGRRLGLNLRSSERGEVILAIEGGHGVGRPKELLERVPGLVAIWQRPGPRSRSRLLGGNSGMTAVWNREEADSPDAVFLQVNRAAARELEDFVVRRIGPVDGLTVIDAYCGVGSLAKRLALLGARVTGIELDPAAVKEARRRVGDGARILEGRVERLLGNVSPADVLVVNPPRAGLARSVTESVAESPPRRMLYVSCDPATLARDIHRMSNVLRMSAVRCFDLFPQTAHVETVVELECATT